MTDLKSEQRLMYVWQAVCASDDSLCEGYPRTSLVKIVTEKLFGFNSGSFEETFINSTVDFYKYKEYLQDFANSKNLSLIELCESVEQQCWTSCLPSYDFQTLKTKQVKLIWEVFNRLCLVGSYPPVIPAADACWFHDEVIKENGRTRTHGLICRGLKFNEFLARLENSLGGGGLTSSIADAITDIHESLVLEIIKAGWLYTRHPKAGKWKRLIWYRRWVELTPTKLRWYDNEYTEKRAMMGEIQVDDGLVVEPMEPVRGLTTKITNRFQIRDQIFGQDEVSREFSASSSFDKRDWVKKIQECSKDKQDLDGTLLKLPAGLKAIQESASAPHLLQLSMAGGDRADSANAAGVPRQSFSIQTDVRINRIRAIFNQVDKNGNGMIDREEFFNFIQELGVTIGQEETDTIFDEIDTGQNGLIYFAEFYRYFAQLLLHEDALDAETASDRKLRAAFLQADRDGSGKISFREFAEYSWDRNRLLAYNELTQTFDEFAHCDDGEIDLEGFKSFLTSCNLRKETMEENETDNPLQEHLVTLYRRTPSRELTQFLKERWKKFANFKRYGCQGDVVMRGCPEMVADIVPGKYALVDLACFNDLPPIEPKHACVTASWIKSQVDGKSGLCILPRDFNGKIPVEISTNEYLSFYGASLADNRQLQICLLYRHGIQDFTYENNYVTDYVTSRAGIEKHDFTHLDCPLEDDSGYFVLGKLVESCLYLTAFKIPTRHTLYVPGGVIHSNDYLKGTWRTMLSDEAEIDHVCLARGNIENHENFLLEFETHQEDIVKCNE